MNKTFKKLTSVIAMVSMLIGCGANFEVTPMKSISIEYGSSLNNDLLFDKEASSEGTKVKSVNGFDSSKVGEHTISVIFTDKEEKKDFEATVKVVVEDTKLPKITLTKDKMEITEGDELDLKKLVKEVKDPVDGDIDFSDKKVNSNGWYFDKGALDTSKAGTYDVKVIALDVNGNTSEAVLKVVVKEKPVVQNEQQSSNQSQTTEDQHVCNPISLGNCGLLFATKDDAANYGDSLITQNQATSYYIEDVYCQCGSFLGWSISSIYEEQNKVPESSKPQAPSSEDDKEKEEKEEKVCEIEWDKPNAVGNSGFATYSMDEADDYVEKNLPLDHGATIISRHDSCGNEYWTVHWYELKE